MLYVFWLPHRCFWMKSRRTSQNCVSVDQPCAQLFPTPGGCLCLFILFWCFNCQFNSKQGVVWFIMILTTWKSLALIVINKSSFSLTFFIMFISETEKDSCQIVWKKLGFLKVKHLHIVMKNTYSNFVLHFLKLKTTRLLILT